MFEGDTTTLSSRLGNPLCTGLPWLGPDVYEAPQGMLQRPDGCVWAHHCAADRCCWQARQKEKAAWDEHRERHRYDVRTGRAPADEAFEEYAGLRAA